MAERQENIVPNKWLICLARMACYNFVVESFFL